jgi:hypothetical protein
MHADPAATNSPDTYSVAKLANVLDRRKRWRFRNPSGYAQSDNPSAPPSFRIRI